jgi:hypothetical protein
MWRNLVEEILMKKPCMQDGILCVGLFSFGGEKKIL